MTTLPYPGLEVKLKSIHYGQWFINTLVSDAMCFAEGTSFKLSICEIYHKFLLDDLADRRL